MQLISGVNHTNRYDRAFTLIELSIVLVVIGLIVGGILVGRDLISSATVRSQISQMEHYQQAVNTFRGKYGYLPGDIPGREAGMFGFTLGSIWQEDEETSIPIAGDGDGLIDTAQNMFGGVQLDDNSDNGWNFTYGEAAMVMRHLVQAKLINSDNEEAKVGRNAHIIVWNGGWGGGQTNKSLHGRAYMDGINYFGVFDVTRSYVALTVKEAYSIDTKIDDGKPQSGGVLAFYPVPDNRMDQGNNGFSNWARGGEDPYSGSLTGGLCYRVGGSVACGPYAPDGYIAVPDDDGSCYAAPGKIGEYSIGRNNGTGVNCALSFKFH